MNPISLTNSTINEISSWLALAREAEPLFGPMADDPDFQKGLLKAIQDGRAIAAKEEKTSDVLGGVIIDPEQNEILWLVVKQSARGRGTGQALLEAALERLDIRRPVRVQTYDESVPAGLPARALYTRFGFVDLEPAGLNPAGLPTVIMQKPAF